MFRGKAGKLIKYSLLGGAAIGIATSLRTNDWNSIGIVRLTRAACTVTKISYTYKTKLLDKKLDKESQEYKELKSLCHQEAAEQLLKLCCTNKGVYIKVGQHIAALDYLLPREYVQTMKVLHNNAPTNSIEEVLKVIKEDLKTDPKELFVQFDEEPLGTASLAQVHRAVLKDGSVVAVKVQHPYVLGNAKVDMKTMEILVKIVSRLFPEFRFQWLVDETKKNLPQELNFALEGRNAEKLQKLLHYFKWLRVPNVRWDLTTPRILTMEFVEGGQVNDLNYIKKHKIDPFEISDKLGSLYSHMIFIHGFVHSDPHPGNVLVKKSEKGDCEIILLDHGLYATLGRDFITEYANLWLSILDRDRKGMRRHATNLGVESDLYGLFSCMVTGRTWETIMEGVEKKKPSAAEKDVFQKEFPNFLPLISSVLDRVNRQMLLVLKTNDLMRGIEHTLQTSYRMGSFKVMTECCVCSIYSDRILKAGSKFSKFKLTVLEWWALLKINLFYKMMTVRHIIGV